MFWFGQYEDNLGGTGANRRSVKMNTWKIIKGCSCDLTFAGKLVCFP